MEELGRGLKKLVLAGIGAIAVGREKGEELLEELVKRGELTVEQGKVLNEELKRNVAESIRENVEIHMETAADDANEPDESAEADAEEGADWLQAVDSLSDADFEALKRRIARREAADQSQEDKTDGGEA